MSLSVSLHAHESLNKAQAIPVVGPLIASPIAAVVSLAQLIVGVVGGIFSLIVSVLTNGKHLSKPTFTLFGHAGLGLLHFTFATANILSLGYVAHKIKQL